MKKKLTFTLYCNNSTYNIGTIKNAEIVKIVYP